MPWRGGKEPKANCLINDNGGTSVNFLFAKTLRKLREEKGLSQKQLGQQMFVNHSTVARWENASRLPDAAMILRLAGCLGVDANELFRLAAQSEESPNVIIVDDRKIVLSGSLPILEETMPKATVIGFTRPSEAIEYAKANQVALAFLDIELGTTSGLDLCKRLLEINPRTNVVFLTAYVGYSFDAWSTGACGFMLKPITKEALLGQMKLLRYPIAAWGGDQE